MKALLDTHNFIWWGSDPQRLSPQVLDIWQNSENILLVGVASLWEMQIKFQLGKLKLHMPLADLVSAQQQVNKIQILDVKLEHVMALGELPPYHRDPFDRLLIAQTNIEKAILLSRDAIFVDYPVEVVW